MHGLPDIGTYIAIANKLNYKSKNRARIEGIRGIQSSYTLIRKLLVTR